MSYLVLNFRFSCLGWVKVSWQVSVGIKVHCGTGFSFGTSLVTNLHTFWGFRSQVSSGTSTNDVTTLLWHTSWPSLVMQPAPQISIGNFSHLQQKYWFTFKRNLRFIKEVFCFRKYKIKTWFGNPTLSYFFLDCLIRSRTWFTLN